jgi:hypothetical protein
MSSAANFGTISCGNSSRAQKSSMIGATSLSTKLRTRFNTSRSFASRVPAI